MSINIKILQEYSAEAFGVKLSEAQLLKLSAYADEVLETNKSFNLTAITDETDFLYKHIIDSLAGINFLKTVKTPSVNPQPIKLSVCDIGSGAGFPASVLAIVKPDFEVTAMDSTAKKMAFIEKTAEKLKIENLKTAAVRAEGARNLFNKFDCVTARAVASLPVLLELAFPLLKTNGMFVAYKADESELTLCKNALATLGGKHTQTFDYSLPNGDKRAVIVFKKTAATPEKYPRAYGAIKKKPL